MNKKLIWKEYQKKIKQIDKYNKKYYEENLSTISDNEYDELKKEIINLESKFSFLEHKKSPSKQKQPKGSINS